MHKRDAQLRGALGRRGRHAGRQEADLQADALRPDHDDTVPDVELLAFAAVAVQHDSPVREDAIDIEQDQSDAGGFRFNRHGSRGSRFTVQFKVQGSGSNPEP